MIGMMVVWDINPILFHPLVTVKTINHYLIPICSTPSTLLVITGLVWVDPSIFGVRRFTIGRTNHWATKKNVPAISIGHGVAPIALVGQETPSLHW